MSAKQKHIYYQILNQILVCGQIKNLSRNSSQEYIFPEFIFLVQTIINDFFYYTFLKEIFFQVEQDDHKYRTS